MHFRDAEDGERGVRSMFIKEKEELVQFSLKLFNEKLIVGTWGNLSLRVNDGERDLFLVTPSGMDYEKTHIEDIVVVDEVGNIVEGGRKPSSELQMHLNIYNSRKEIKAVFHTHSTCATACAVAGVEIPMVVEDMVQQLGGEVRLAKYALPGTEELAKNVAEALSYRNGALLKNHGAVGVGKSAVDAYKACVLIEKSAQILIYAKILGNVNLVDREDAKKMVDYYNNQYGQR